MSELTPNLKLFKYNTETDAKQPFSINDCMNANWDKIDANLIGADKIEEQLTDKVDLSSLVECQVVIDTYVNGTSGYRIWSDGYCEQWGAKVPSQASWKEITLIKTYRDTNYLVLTGCNGNVNGTSNWTTVTNGQAYTTSSIKILGVNADASWLIAWKTCGYLAKGEY